MRSLFIALALLSAAAPAHAHPATEQFIPIGRSPGVNVISGRAETQGEIAASGATTPVMIAGRSGPAFVIGPKTRIYIDRSIQKQPSTVGTAADIKPGSVVEARLADPNTRVAAWVKVWPQQ